MIVDNEGYSENVTFSQHTLYNGVAGKNIYVNSGVVLILQGICDGNIYLNKNSFCEMNGILEGNLVYGEGTFEYNGIVKGLIIKN
jgi:hypothetical protein